MDRLFVTFFRQRESWRALPREARQVFAESVIKAIDTLPDMGVEVVAWASNSPKTDMRAPFDYFCVYRVRDEDVQISFDEIVRRSGWYEYFDQIAGTGVARPPNAILQLLL